MRILYISFNCNYSDGVNSLRVFNVLKILAKNRHQVTFITPKAGFRVRGVKNIVVKLTLDRGGRVSRLYSNLVKPLFDESDSLSEERWVKDVQRYLEQNESKFKAFDFIYVNIHPICLIRAGVGAKKLFGGKLIVDMQDPFYFNPYKRILKIFDKVVKRKEENLLKVVDFLIVCHKSVNDVYQKAYPNLKVIFISNLPPVEIYKIRLAKKKQQTQYQISYGGSLFIGRDLFLILDVLKEFKEKFRIEVLGNVSLLNKMRYLLHKNLKWGEISEKQKYYQHLNDQVDIGVVLQSFNTQDTGCSLVASKTFEYLYLNKPIIYLGPKGDNSDLISQTSDNCCVVTNKTDSKKIEVFLRNFQPKINNTRKEFYKVYKADKIFQPLIKIVGGN